MSNDLTPEEISEKMVAMIEKRARFYVTHALDASFEVKIAGALFQGFMDGMIQNGHDPHVMYRALDLAKKKLNESSTTYQKKNANA